MSEREPVHLLDAAGAARLLAVPTSWVLEEARHNRIPHIRLGRYVRFDGDELLDWARNRSRGPSYHLHNDKAAPAVLEHPEA
jgi:excisionase family DNA binding protein